MSAKYDIRYVEMMVVRERSSARGGVMQALWKDWNSA